MSDLVYNTINLGFANLEVYTSENGVEKVVMKSKDAAQAYHFEVPNHEIYSEKVVE